MSVEVSLVAKTQLPGRFCDRRASSEETAALSKAKMKVPRVESQSSASFESSDELLGTQAKHGCGVGDADGFRETISHTFHH